MGLRHQSLRWGKGERGGERKVPNIGGGAKGVKMRDVRVWADKRWAGLLESEGQVEQWEGQESGICVCCQRWYHVIWFIIMWCGYWGGRGKMRCRVLGDITMKIGGDRWDNSHNIHVFSELGVIRDVDSCHESKIYANLSLNIFKYQ